MFNSNIIAHDCDIPVSKEFYNLFYDSYNFFTEYQKLLACHLLFSSFVDTDSSVVVIDRNTLASLEDKLSLVSAGKYRSLASLESFQGQTGVELVITEPLYLLGKARTASLILSDRLRELLFTSLSQNIQEVFFVSGKSYSVREKRAYIQRFSEKRSCQNDNLDAKRPNYSVAYYLNQLPAEGFLPYKNLIPDARRHIIKTMTGRKLKLQLGIINSLEDYFPPTYQQVENSERVFAVGKSAAYLSSSVRNILFASCWKADLNNAHLVIASHLWGLKDILNLIEKEKSIWPYLVHSMNLKIEDKQKLKTIVYATVYGMKKGGIRKTIIDTLGKEHVKSVMQNEIIFTLLDARETAIEKIKQNNGIRDAYNNFHDLNSVNRKPEDAIRTLLSREIGSYEFRVMAPAAKIAEQSGGRVRIPLWLHDGVYVSFRDASRAESYKKQIKHAVHSEAKRLGLPLILGDE